MKATFFGANSIIQNLSDWNFASLTDMSFMCYDALLLFNQNLCAWMDHLQETVQEANVYVQSALIDTACPRQDHDGVVSNGGPLCHDCTVAAPSLTPTPFPQFGSY
jgi:Mycoplasma protein of unknown function, DUF285